MRKTLAVLFGLLGVICLGTVLVQTLAAGEQWTFVLGLSVVMFLIAGLLVEFD